MLHKINITGEMQVKAKEIAIFRRDLARKNNCTPIFQTESLDNEIVGILGEEIFKIWLKQNNVQFERNVVHGEADHGDFVIYGKIVDVKTASKPFYKMIMMPVIQFLKNKRDFYVAIRLNLDEGFAEIMGVATHDELLKAPVRDFGHNIDTKALEFSKLTPIDEMIIQRRLS